MDDLSFDILSWNVRGLEDYQKRRKLFNWVKKHTSKNAIVFMQETHSSDKAGKQWEQLWRGSIKFSHGTTSSKGVLIAFSENLEFNITKEFTDQNGRYIVRQVDIQENPYVLIHYYVPNLETQQVSALDELTKVLSNLELKENTNLILGGDFNLILNVKLDADGRNPTLKSNSMKSLNILTMENDLVDIWRIRNPESNRYTWRKKTPMTQRRLDYFFVSDSFQDSVHEVEILTGIQSDHSPIRIQCRSLEEERRGPSHWKFNNSLLLDSEYIELANSEISDLLDPMTLQTSDPRVKWEFFKYNIRKLTIKYSKERAKHRRESRANLEKRVKFYEDNLNSNSDDSFLKEYQDAKVELETMYNHITEGIIIWSRCDWYELGEKSSRYFLGLEKRNKTKTHLRNLVTGNEVDEITDPKHIRSELKSFYSNLYKRRSMKTEAECLEYLNSINIPCLTDSDTQSCEGRLTVKECWDALRSMKNNKSPGNDGITKEFFEYFGGKLGSFLVSTLNHSFEKGELSASQKQAIITLIKKKDKDKRLIKNWRPISLINVDIKVASKAIANRLKAVIHNLISVDQTAYVKGRFIGESIRVINDLIEHIDREDEEGILFSTDIEKAFDSVDHNFLFATLKRYGFGTEFVNFIKTLLFDAQSCVINNGYTTDYFKLERGTRQGDPLSAYLFILVFEVLLIQVREDIDIKGFTVNDVELKLSCYADDGYFMVKTVDSVKKF